MAQITTLDSVSKLLKYVTITLPPFVTKSDDSYIRQFLSSILEVFKINIDQLNQMFNNTFISEAEDGDLEKLILDVSNVTRKDGETDEDYRNRFYKYVYRYNATANSIEEIVYDTLGYYPIKLTESGARTAYWGLHDLLLEDRVANSAYFYDDVNEYTAYWGRYQSQQSSENEKYFVGIIHLTERPPQEKLDELCDVIERVRKKGTKIYLQFLDNIDIILEPVVTIVEEDAFTFAWRLVPSAFSYEVQIDEDPLFGSPTTYITSSTSYSFSGLSGGVTYYTRVRYENDDGYSEWTEPVETTTNISLGTPITTEETDVGVSGKLANIFTANWGSASGATSYIFDLGEDVGFSAPTTNYNNINVGNVVSKNVILDLENKTNNVIDWKFQDGSGTTISTSTIGSISGSFIGGGGSEWVSSLISSDNYSIDFSGLNYINTSASITSIVGDFTVRAIMRFESGDKASKPFHPIISKWNSAIVDSAGNHWIAEYVPSSNKLFLYIYDSTDNSANYNMRYYQANCPTINEGQDYIFQLAFKLVDPSNSNLNTCEICVNGTKLVGGFWTNSRIGFTNITSIKNNNYPIEVCSYNDGATRYYGKYRMARVRIDSEFLTENDALRDAKNLGIISQDLYYRVKATDGVLTSPYSNIITVNK